MAAMRSRSERAERLLVAVETTFGSGDFRADERLLVREVRQQSDRAESIATIGLRLDDELDSEEVRRRYPADRRLIVTTEDPDPTRRAILFDGYAPLQWSRWDGRPSREPEGYGFEAEHVFARLSRDHRAWVYGRRVRSNEIEDGLRSDPERFADQSVLMTALPSVFNPSGVPNRAVEPLQVRSRAGESRTVPLFTADGASAVKWTYAEVLRYLVWFHLPANGVVGDGNVFVATDERWLSTASDPLSEALRREPVSLACEAVNLADALALWASAAGLHITCETVNVAGGPATQLRVWSGRGGPLRRLHLARGGRRSDGEPRYDTRGRSVGRILSENNTYRGEVRWDHRPIVNRPIVLGDVKRYEMTVPLWPGWRPVASLDSVALPDRAGAKALALTPEQVKALGEQADENAWYRRYHRGGSEHLLYADIARLWVLNEDGRCDAATYDRNAPFDAYKPFDFSTVLSAAAADTGVWMRRARPLGRTVSCGADGESLGVWVEVSFDEGGTWYPFAGRLAVLNDRAGIRFDEDNPTSITPPGIDPEEQNLWYAIVDQTFRVRVTAVIESDERLTGTVLPAGLDSPTLHVNTVIVRDPASYRFVSRSDAVNVLAGITAAGSGVRDDSQAIMERAARIAGQQQDRRVHVLPTIPWIETAYAIGDRIAGIQGREVSFATTVGCEMRYPTVVGRRFVLQDGRYETELTLG